MDIIIDGDGIGKEVTHGLQTFPGQGQACRLLTSICEQLVEHRGSIGKPRPHQLCTSRYSTPWEDVRAWDTLYQDGRQRQRGDNLVGPLKRDHWPTMKRPSLLCVRHVACPVRLIHVTGCRDPDYGHATHDVDGS